MKDEISELLKRIDLRLASIQAELQAQSTAIINAAEVASSRSNFDSMSLREVVIEAGVDMRLALETLLRGMEERPAAVTSSSPAIRRNDDLLLSLAEPLIASNIEQLFVAKGAASSSQPIAYRLGISSDFDADLGGTVIVIKVFIPGIEIHVAREWRKQIEESLPPRLSGFCIVRVLPDSDPINER